MADPTFTVIVRTYNRAKVLTRAVDSALKQTFSDFEILVIDDGSTDNTEELVGQFLDIRVRYYKHEKNMGVCHSANTGIRLARGEYIAFLDSDDEWLPGMLEKVHEKFISDHDILCVYTFHKIIASDGKITPVTRYALEGYIYKEALAQGYVSPMITLSVKKQCFDVVGDFESDIMNGEDDVMCFKLAKEFKFGLVKEILAVIHPDGGNRVTADAAHLAEDSYRLYNKFEDDIVKYCGRKAMAKHYTHSAELYLRARNRTMALKVLCKGLKYSISFRGGSCLVLSLLPLCAFRKIRALRQRILSYAEKHCTQL